MGVRLLLGSWLAVLAVAGLMWQECLLLAAVGLAAQRPVLWSGSRRTACDPWRIALRCLTFGCIGLVGAIGLGRACRVAMAAGWTPAHLAPAATVWLIAGTTALVCGVQTRVRACLLEAGLWLPLLLAAAGAMVAPPTQQSVWACAVFGMALLVLLGTSWRLARGGTAWLGAGGSARG